MTSQERHELRYQRRKKKRQERLDQIANKSFNEVFNYENLLNSGLKCCNGVRWKASTVAFENNIVKNIIDIEDELNGLTPRRFKRFHSFKTIEHGKTRDIDAIPIWDRTQQKCFNQNFLVPLYTRSFIKDNAASVKGGGVEFTLKRLKKKLRRHFIKFGQKGGILLFDFKNYFLSIPHNQIKIKAENKIKDDKLKKIFNIWIDDFNKLKTSIKQNHGIGLGSEVSQVIALEHLNPLDHYFSDYLGVKYARYMDDGYIISEDVNKLKQYLKDLIYLSNKLGVILSLNKCKIIPFKNNNFFNFLKFRICLKNTGKIVILPNRKTFTRERNKLKKLRLKINDGILCFFGVSNSLIAWNSHIRQCTAYKTYIYKMLIFFKTLFKDLYINRIKLKGFYKHEIQMLQRI